LAPHRRVVRTGHFGFHCAAFKPGVQIKFADGQVRKISKVFKVGSNLSIYVHGGLLDGGKVGAPRTVSTVVATAAPSAPAAPAPVVTAPSAPSSTYTASMNSFTNTDWQNGIYRKSAGFSIPDTGANKAAFVVGSSVKLADGQVRTVAAVYDVGAHLSVMLKGTALSASAVGYPKTISVVSGSTGTSYAASGRCACSGADPCTSPDSSTCSGPGSQ
jgi:endoglucanase